jgi:membrane-bound lytic murein transglycosylase D
MKNILLVIALTAALFASCGGNKPKTVPEKSQTQTEAASLERFQEPGETPEANTPDMAVETSENQTIPPPIKAETIPILEPRAVETDEVTDHIAKGITGIFREFGYSGELDVPVNFKRRVAHYIRYFSNDEKGSRFYSRAMSRADQYLPMIREALKEKHLPLSLAYLPAVESGFNPNARSRAGAVGMWQFMKNTARMYGLTVSRHRDERKDPARSTAAAAEYLNDLLAMFGLEDPFLGICAYNAGEGKILSALRKISFTERSFWTLVRKKLLQTETDDYIPQFMAIILMNNDPETYIAASKTVPVAPDDDEDREIIDALHDRVAVLADDEGVGEEIETAVPSAQAPTRIYRIKPGDTLYSIARNFNVSVADLKAWNRLSSNRIHPGRELSVSSSAGNVGKSKPLSHTSNEKRKPYKLTYTVNYKDTLVRIALLFKGVSVRDIMAWNGLKRSRIYPKQKLALYLDQPPRKVVTHVVKPGESAGKIAGLYGRRIECVLALNGLVGTSLLMPGKQLKIYYF